MLCRLNARIVFITEMELGKKIGNRMKNYRYDLISACHQGIEEHPQRQMKNLGFEVVKFECFSFADCWMFRTTNEIENIPVYLTKLDDDAKFSDEIRLEIRRCRKNLYEKDSNMTDLQILEEALNKIDIGYDNISNKMVIITARTEERFLKTYENSLVFEFDENGSLKSILAQGE